MIDDAHDFDDAVRDLVIFSGTSQPHDAAIAERVVSQLVLMRIGACYENGRQPLDLLHVVRRESSARVVKVAADAIVAHKPSPNALAFEPPQERVPGHRHGPVPEVLDPSWNIMRVPAFRRLGCGTSGTMC